MVRVISTTQWFNHSTLIAWVKDFRITTYSEVNFPNHVNPVRYRLGGCKVQLVDDTQLHKLRTISTDHYSPRVDLLRLLQSCCIYSVECIVASVFINQHKQFTNRLTNSINNNINLFIRKWEDNIMIIVTDNWVNTGLFMATFRQHMYMPAHYFDFFSINN